MNETQKCARIFLFCINSNSALVPHSARCDGMCSERNVSNFLLSLCALARSSLLRTRCVCVSSPPHTVVESSVLRRRNVFKLPMRCFLSYAALHAFRSVWLSVSFVRYFYLGCGCSLSHCPIEIGQWHMLVYRLYQRENDNKQFRRVASSHVRPPLR